MTPVFVAGSIKSRFNSYRHKCSGNVEVLYEEQWLPLRQDALGDVNTRNTICKELNCGQALEKIPYFGPRPDSHTVTVSGCSGSEIAKCKDVTWEEKSQTPELGGLQCSG